MRGVSLLTLLVLAAACSQSAEPTTPLPPNVILVTVDTLRADHLGAYGYPRDTSPNLDRWASRSMFFERAVVQWPKTSPSFASMLTSTYPHENGVVRSTKIKIDPEFTLLAEYLKSGGYATAAAVSNPNLGRAFGFDRGFDEFAQSWAEFPQEATEASVADGLPGPFSDAKCLTYLALERLDRLPEGRPVFLWAHYIDPHTPYHPPQPYSEMFVGDEHFDATRVADFIPDEKLAEKPFWAFGGINPGLSPRISKERGERRLDYYVAEYDAEIRTVDEQIQVLLDELARRGLLENAVVVFTSDHGESLGEHNYYFEHGRLPYQPCAHVPLWIQYPGMPAAQSIQAPVPLLDLVPTVLDLVGLPAPQDVAGQSLRSLMEGEAAAARPYVFMESGVTPAPDYQWSVRDRRHKLVRVPHPADRRLMTAAQWELYDLEADPGETHNLIDVEVETAARLQARLEVFMERARQRARGQGTVESMDELPAEMQEALQELGYLHDGKEEEQEAASRQE